MAGRRGGRRKKQANGVDNGAGPGAGHNTGTGESSVNQEATRNANVQERKAAIERAMESVYQLDKDIAAVIAEEIAPLREDKSAVMKSLRERFQITAEVFRARYYAYRLKRRAEDANDEITQDALAELFEVCPVSGQGSFATALDATRPGVVVASAPREPAAPVITIQPADGSSPVPPSPPFEEAAAVDPEAAWEMGSRARKEGRPVSEHPFTEPHQHVARARFEQGWSDEDYEIRRARGEARPDA